MQRIRPFATVPISNLLGEGVLWDDAVGAFLWTDIHGRKLHRYHPDGERLAVWDTPERLCSFGLIDGEAGALIAAFESGFAVYRFESGEVEWLARPEADVTGTRFNDGRVDRQGRFWSGTMVEGDEARNREGNRIAASLYRVERGVCARMEGGLRITNSLCWSRDSSTQYLADSPAREIYAYDFDAVTGSIANRRVFARIAPPAEPDGSCVDAEDHLWNAEWGGGRIVRYRPDGEISLTLPLPVTQPTCVCFGGPALNWLAVTTARVGLSEEELARQPLAGALLIFETDFRGVAESRYVAG